MCRYYKDKRIDRGEMVVETKDRQTTAGRMRISGGRADMATENIEEV